MASVPKTGRPATAAAITASEQRYRDLVESSHDWIWEIDASGRYTYASPQVFEIFGYRPEEIIGKSPFDLMPPAEAERVGQLFAGILARRAPFRRLENVNLRKDGSTIVLATSGVPFFDEQGAFCGYRGMDQDITAQKLAEDKLRASEERHRTILQASIDGYFLADRQGRIIEVNDAYCRMCGYSEQELLAMRLFDLEVAETEEEIIEHLQMVMARGFAVFALRQRRKDGSYFDIEHRVQYRSAEGGQFVGFTRDISAVRKQEAYRAMGQDILSILNRDISMKAALSRVVATIRAATAADAVGIRLQDGDDFPYYWQEGFPVDFMRKENSLLLRKQDRGVCRSETGEVSLECTCGLVICGKADPDNPLFTRGGSAWTNDSSQLLQLSPEEDPRTAPRNECIHQHYGSVALIPVRAKGRIVGLLQLNAQRQNFFTLPDIELLEHVAETIGESLLRKKAEEQLRQERNRAQSYLDAVETIIVALDAAGRITTINRKACQLLGYREEELLGRSWFAAGLLPDDGGDGQHRYRRLMAGEIVSIKEYQEHPVVTRSGAVRHIAWHNALLYDDRGEISGVLSAGDDITERKKAENDLSKLYQAVEQSPATILITDLQGNLEYVNPAFCRLTGYQPAEVLGRNPRLLKSGVTSAAEYQRLWETITAGRTWYGEFCNRKKSGETYWERTCIAPITDEAGEIRHFVAIKEDISTQKQHEEDKVRLEAQLLQAQKLESVGRLAGGVAHDFNNILMIIRNYAHICLMESQAEPIQPFLKEIQKATRRAADLTNQLLAFARKQSISPRVVDLNDTVTGMLKMLQRLLGENIQLVWQPAPNLWPVKLDPVQVDQILANLCVNSRDAIADIGRIVIETGNRRIEAHDGVAQRETPPGEYVLLSVSDNGCGIDPETVPHIFEPFFTTKTAGEGTGLGLATVYGIVQQNCGFIEVSSALGGGTTFAIYLPRHIQAELPPQAADIEEPALQGTETILLVEDDEDILASTTIILKSLGYTVLAAHSAAVAIRRAEEYHGTIELLLTDLVMPGMNGRELADYLQRGYPQLKCLFMSGYTADIISRHGIIGSGVHFIPKPFTVAAVATKLRAILDSD